MKEEIAGVRADKALLDYEREAKVSKLEHQAKAIAGMGELSEVTRMSQSQDEAKNREKAELFYQRLPAWRNFDRMVMVAVYVFFSVLVWIAWRKRTAEGRA